jgi:hypothetical protein
MAEPRDLLPTVADPWLAPPTPDRRDGARRRVGVEIEFGGLSVATTAEAVLKVFGGSLRWDGIHRAIVTTTTFGEFRVELDMSLAHRALDTETERKLRDAVVDFSSAVVPVEIVCPPIDWDQAHRLDDLRGLLQRMGAEGTRDGLLYAFGTQLNPEPPDLGTETILATLRAFLLLRDWLRRQILVDPLRWLWRFADPFPSDYIAIVLDSAYAPEMATLIDDYLRHNRTRNRELDLLPLFCHLDAKRVRAVLPHEKINARPTWHYRLPNSDIDNPGWTVGLEWARWVRVERLAAQPEILSDAGAAWLANHARLLPSSWEPQSIALANRI